MFIQNKFILDHHTPVPVDTRTQEGLIEWAEWFDSADRRVAKTRIGDSIEVLTVFLALDYGYGLSDRPVLFETTVFRNGQGDERDRCCTWEEAEIMHEDMVKRVKAESGG